MYPPSVICGTISNVIPTFWRSTDWKIWPVSAALAVAEDMNGTFWPTTIVASSLSAVSSVGADRTLEWVSVSIAVISAISHGTVTLVGVVPVVVVVEAAALSAVLIV